MVAKKGDSLTERRSVLARMRGELEGELLRLLRQEEYLRRQITRARDQLRYYERHLAELRHSVGRSAPLQEFARRLG